MLIYDSKETTRKSSQYQVWQHKSKPKLNASSRNKRLAFAIKKVAMSADQWSKVIWTDEKKFNLDGPDGLRSYWYDLRSEKTIFSKRHSGGSSCMIWAGLNENGVTPLAFCSGKMNSESYQGILASHLLPNASNLTHGNFILMQDNAPPHRSRSTTDWLTMNQVEKFDWPPYSPDLNRIENLWGWLVRKVYDNGRQFDSIDQLKREIVTQWSKIPLELTKSLCSSIKNRLIKVIQNKGGSIDY